MELCRHTKNGIFGDYYESGQIHSKLTFFPHRDCDLSMLAVQQGKESNADDWIKLFKDADEGFRILSWKYPVGSKIGPIEAVRQTELAFV